MAMVDRRYNCVMQTTGLTRRTRIIVAVATLTMLGAVPCKGTKRAPDERIISFATDITIRADTSIEVREEFAVHSEETYFKWGMIRHLPITSNERWDKRFGGE